MFLVLYRKILNWREIEQSTLYVRSSEGLLKCVSLHQLMLQSIEQLSTMIEAAGMIISNANSHSWKQDGWPLQKKYSFLVKPKVLKTHEKFGNQNKQGFHWRSFWSNVWSRPRLCSSLPFIVHLKPAVELGSFSNIGALCLVKRVVGKEPKVVKYPIRC